MQNEKCGGEDCPRCGCNDTRRAGRVALWGQGWQRWECNHCGHQFDRAPQEKPEQRVTVVYPVMICPYCGADKTHVTSTQGPTRYHKCDGCGRTWSSEERREVRKL